MEGRAYATDSRRTVMTFSTLLWIILFGYAAYYGGLITYDEFRKDDIPLEAKVDEEEIDISGEASEFHPKDVKKESKNKQNEKEEREEAIMSGNIEINDLVPMVNELAEKGDESLLASIVDDWQEVEQAA
jgi:hypothetical protein